MLNEARGCGKWVAPASFPTNRDLLRSGTLEAAHGPRSANRVRTDASRIALA
jgi:hypothetical protein